MNGEYESDIINVLMYVNHGMFLLHCFFTKGTIKILNSLYRIKLCLKAVLTVTNLLNLSP